MAPVIRKEKHERQALKRAGLQVVRARNVVTKFRKCRVIMFKIDMSWQPILTLKLRLDATPLYKHEGVQPGGPAD